MARKKQVSFGERVGHALSDVANATSVAATGQEIGIIELAAEEEIGVPSDARPLKPKAARKKSKAKRTAKAAPRKPATKKGKKKAAPKKASKKVSKAARAPKKKKRAAKRR